MDRKQRRESAEKWRCPDCGGKLTHVYARRMHQAHEPRDLARMCNHKDCTFICFMGEKECAGCGKAFDPHSVKPLTLQLSTAVFCQRCLDRERRWWRRFWNWIKGVFHAV